MKNEDQGDEKFHGYKTMERDTGLTVINAQILHINSMSCPETALVINRFQCTF